MPTFTIETPNGRRVKLEADNEEAAMAGAQQWYDDTDAVVRTVYGEARGDPDSQAGVASVILNRSNLTGRSPREVVTEQGQFEPWSDQDARSRMEGLDPRSSEYQDILQRVSPALGGEDTTGGATHFYAPKAQTQLGRQAPSWDDGSGVDLGAHRFFKRPGDFGGKPTVEIGEAEFGGTAEPAPAPAQGPQAGDGRVVNAKTGSPLNPAQTAFYAAGEQQGVIDRNARPGTRALPLAQTSPDDLPPPGVWYVDLNGAPQQVPGGPEETPMWRTGLDVAMDVGKIAFQPLSPMLSMTDRVLPDDPRAQAIESGAISGLLMGGKNELGAALEAAPQLFAGGIDPAHRRFAESLAQRDTADETLEANFPIAMNLGRLEGAGAGALIVPEAKGIGMLPGLARGGQASAMGAAGGFLGTDGTLEDRNKGAALGAVLSPVLGAAARPLMAGAGRAPVTAAATREADAALQTMGTSAADLTPDAQAALQGLIQRGYKPSDAVRLVLAKDLQTPIPMTQGDVTGLPTDQLNFNLARRGARGDRAAQTAQDFAARQQEAIRQNVEQIATGIGGGQRPGYGEGAARTSEALGAAERASKQGVDAAYDAARKAEPVVVPVYDMERLAGSLQQRLNEKFDPGVIKDVRRIIGEGVGATTNAGGPVRKLYEMRQRLSSLRANNDVQAVAAGEAIKEFDAFMSDAVTADLLHGDPAAVMKWRDAVSSRWKHGRIFQDGDLVERLTERTGSGDTRRLAIDPGDAANLIFGRSALGMAGRRGLYRDLDKIKNMVDEPTWNSLRAEPFQRLAQSAEGAVENGAQQFSGVKFLKGWNDLKAKDMRLVESLYTPQEIAEINRFAATAGRVMSPARGGDNSSNTAVAALKVASGRLFKALPWIGDTLVKQVDEVLGDMALRRATSPEARRAVVGPLGGAPGGAGGAAGGRIASPQDERAPGLPAFSR